jgi:hypothetical protein
VIPLNKELKAALEQIQKAQVGGRASPFVVTTERARQTSAAAIVNLFAVWYRALGFNGCSSHSGRRGFAELTKQFKAAARSFAEGALQTARQARSTRLQRGDEDSSAGQEPSAKIEPAPGKIAWLRH